MVRIAILHVLSLLFLMAIAEGFPENNDNNTISSYKVHIDTEQCVYQTGKRFLSIALPSGLIKRNWRHFKFRSAKLKNLAKGLAPAYLRLGGTAADFLWFDRQSKLKITQHGAGSGMEPSLNLNSNFTMTAKDVDEIFTFANETGLSVIFGLNILSRDSKTHRWNSSNAENLMKYIASQGFSCAWELGNEPIDLENLVSWNITGKGLALDFRILRQLLNNHPEYGRMIIGPDANSPWRKPRDEFLKEFLKHINGSIDAITYHQYYTNNRAKVSEFYDPELLDDLITEIKQLQNITKESGANPIRLWLGETSSAYGGGEPGVSNSYIAGFMWLDKLGVAARLGHHVVIRQTFYSGSYSMINKIKFDPYPDYWSAYLYKKLVGACVLDVHNGMSLGRKVRVYAHCTSEGSSYEAGSLVLIALNTQDLETKLVLRSGLEKLTIHQYLLTPGESHNITSQSVRLNGQVLEMIDDKYLPNIRPQPILPPDNIILPPVSYGFFVIPDAQIEACLHSYPKKTLKI